MGLRHLMSEEVVEAPIHDFVEMPEAEEIQLSEPEQARKKWNAAADAALANMPDGCKFDNGMFDHRFENHFPPFDGIFRIKKDNKTGVVNAHGEIVVPPIYSYIDVESWWDNKTCKQWYLTNVLRMSRYEDDVKKNGYVELGGKEVIPAGMVGDFFDNDSARKAILALKPAKEEVPEWGYDKSVYTYSENGCYGLKTPKGEKVTDEIYYKVKGKYWVNDQALFVVEEERGGESAGVVNQKGKTIIPCKFDGLNIFSDEPIVLICVEKKGKEGVYDLNGKLIVKCAYRTCRPAAGNVICAKGSKDVTLYNTQGQIIINKGQYVDIVSANDGLLTVIDTAYKKHYVDLWGNIMEMKK